MEDSYDYFKVENDAVAAQFSLQEVLEFQLKHDVQVVRGADYQYVVYINNQAYMPSLTPMFALWFGIQQFKMSEDAKQ